MVTHPIFFNSYRLKKNNVKNNWRYKNRKILCQNQTFQNFCISTSFQDRKLFFISIDG